MKLYDLLVLIIIIVTINKFYSASMSTDFRGTSHNFNDINVCTKKATFLVSMICLLDIFSSSLASSSSFSCCDFSSFFASSNSLTALRCSLFMFSMLTSSSDNNKQQTHTAHKKNTLQKYSESGSQYMTNHQCQPQPSIPLG